MLTIALCDNDITIINQLETYIQTLPDRIFTCDSFSDGKQLTSYLEKSKERYPVYFLDIEMPEQNGIETARQIRNTDKDALIIFITDHKEYVYEVFEVLPFRFLEKPVTEDKIKALLKDCAEHLNLFSNLFFFQIGHETLQIPFREIRYFESEGRKIHLYTENSSFSFYGKLSDIMEKLDTLIFSRIHSSYIVNLDYVRSIRQNDIMLNRQELLPISKRYRRSIKDAHLAYLEWRCGK